MKVSLLYLTVILAISSAGATTSDLPPTRGAVINLVEWDGGELPAVYERSDQPPFTRDDLMRLVLSDFEPEQLAQMIAERRYAGDASADGLITLKKAGLTPAVIQAISKHALAPNRSLDLTIYLTFEGSSWSARKRFLYVIVPDGDIQRVFTADLGEVLSGQWKHDTTVDATDPLLPRKIRRVTFAGTLPLKTHGAKTIRVFNSTRPGILHINDIPKTDLAGVQTYKINYPVSSALQDCRVHVNYKQDVMLPDKWHMVDTHLECEWE